MDVWIVLIRDRHSDPDAEPFSSEELAVRRANVLAAQSDGATPEELNAAMIEDGWVLYVPYGTEGDYICVFKRAMDAR